MGLFVQLGVCRRIKPQNCLIVPLNLPPYPVQKVLLIRGAPACNHSGGRFDQSSSHVVTLNRRVETAANIRDWRKEESEWRDDSTLVGLSSVCSSPNSSSAVSHWSSAGYGHNPPKSVTDSSLSRLSSYHRAMISNSIIEFVSHWTRQAWNWTCHL